MNKLDALLQDKPDRLAVIVSAFKEIEVLVERVKGEIKALAQDDILPRTNLEYLKRCAFDYVKSAQEQLNWALARVDLEQTWIAEEGKEENLSG